MTRESAALAALAAVAAIVTGSSAAAAVVLAVFAAVAFVVRRVNPVPRQPIPARSTSSAWARTCGLHVVNRPATA